MNKLISPIIDFIMYITLPVFVWDRIKWSEIKNRRYVNDNLYKKDVEIHSWESAVFLHNQAKDRIDLLQGKLSSLLSILSILIALFALAREISINYSIAIQIICLVLAILGLICAVGPLTITVVQSIDLDKMGNTNQLDDETKVEFKRVIIDMECRSDFIADCLKTTQSIIVVSMIIYICGVFLAPIKNTDKMGANTFNQNVCANYANVKSSNTKTVGIEEVAKDQPLNNNVESSRK